jgi:hypothetical protein
VVEKISPKFEDISKFYGHHDFSLGYLTLADFHIAELSYHVEKLAPELYAKLGFLKKVRDGVEGLPEIKAYYALETAVKGPFVPPTAPVPF